MPFKSLQQMRFMYGQHPDIAKRWTEEQKASGIPFPTKQHQKLITVLRKK